MMAKRGELGLTGCRVPHQIAHEFVPIRFGLAESLPRCAPTPDADGPSAAAVES